jgi:hypothetical protein
MGHGNSKYACKIPGAKSITIKCDMIPSAIQMEIEDTIHNDNFTSAILYKNQKTYRPIAM